MNRLRRAAGGARVGLLHRKAVNALALGCALVTTPALEARAETLNDGMSWVDSAERGKPPLREHRALLSGGTPLSPSRHELTFGAMIGGVWGGAYGTERSLTEALDLEITYSNGHTEETDFTLWSGGFFVAYDYGVGSVRAQATLIARFDTQAYSTGGGEYESLSGASMLSSRYALLVGPSVTLLGAPEGAVDAGLGVGGLLGTYRAAAGLTDSINDFAGEEAIKGPASTGIAGLSGRLWLRAMVWAEDRSFGIGAALYYDLSWLHGRLPGMWQRSWVDHSLGFMLPISGRF